MKGSIDAERDAARVLPVGIASQLLAERQVVVDGLVEGLFELLDVSAFVIPLVRAGVRFTDGIEVERRTAA